jgi:hypothetical protein
MLADATETYFAFVVISTVIGLCLWLGVRLDVRADLSVILGVILAFPAALAVLRWVTPLLPILRRPPRKQRRRTHDSVETGAGTAIENRS